MQSGDIDIAQIGHGAHSLCIGGDAVVFQFDQLSQADAVVVDKSRVASAEELAGRPSACPPAPRPRSSCSTCCVTPA